MTNDILWTAIFSLLILTILFSGLYVAYNIARFKVLKRKAGLSNKLECDKVKREDRIRNYKDYFWSNPMRFTWILLFLVFFVALGLSVDNILGKVSSVLFFLILIGFLIFAYKSYYGFAAKAKARLVAFEKTVKDNIIKEISFSGDNIQSFSANDDGMDTNFQIFDFPVQGKKVQFPPLEDNPKKQPIFESRKLEFLILSREYFSICKGATPFNLFEPKRGPLPKKCAEVKGAGECHEYYYSQMSNVVYEDDSIQIILHNGDRISFKCPKAAPNRKPAMQAIKEKLRITERQRLAKIKEHREFEEIKSKRESSVPSDTDKDT